MLTDGMKRGVAVLLLSVIPAVACLWDRDTLKEEAAGKLDTVKAITGWFDRYPPRYYEMRLQRVTKELAEKPDALELYDDAGVACDRLGRSAWMPSRGSRRVSIDTDTLQIWGRSWEIAGQPARPNHGTMTPRIFLRRWVTSTKPSS
jgi:hypothetical protein